MKKNITVLLLALSLLAGCGGGGDKSTPAGDGGSNIKIGKTDGKYNLWEYMVPSADRTNNFIETKDDKTSKYKTTYTTTGDKVTEISDYAQNEKTIYTKRNDRVTISFEKDGASNGSYDLHLTAEKNGDITILTSTCKLSDHFDNKVINSKTFLDVIEIICNGKPGYYQKGVGEIAQGETLDAKGTSSVRVLAN